MIVFKKYLVIPFSLSILLFLVTAMMPKDAAKVPHSTTDTVSVNVFKLRFTKENGRLVDFRLGESVSSFSNITISVNEPYILAKVDVMLVRGKRPVTLQSYSGKQQVTIDKEFFLIQIQPGDRLNIEFKSVTLKKKDEEIPVVLDVPVFNIPLN